MIANDVFIDALGRVEEHLKRVLDGLDQDDLQWQPRPDANPIGWLAWHITRVEDSQVSRLAGREPAWSAEGWAERFGMDAKAFGFGQKPAEVAAFRSPDAAALLEYHRVVYQRTKKYLEGLTSEDFDRVLPETRWDPPPTVGVRLVSTIDDCALHVGEASYVRGLRQGYGWQKF